MASKNTKTDRHYHTARLQEFRKRHKQLGLCRYCNEPVVDGRTRCRKHIEYQNKWERDKNARANRTHNRRR